MNDSADLLEKLYYLTGADREDQEFPHLDPTTVLRGLSASRIFRLSRPETPGGADDLPVLVGDLIRGLHGREAPGAFFVQSSGREVQCGYAAQAKAFPDGSLAEALRGAFPDARVAVPYGGIQFQAYAHSMALSGAPDLSDDRFRLPRIDRLCRALGGRPWLYLVLLNPVAQAHVAALVNAVTREIASTRLAFTQRGAPGEGSDRTAERYLALLEEKLRELELARREGGWNLAVRLYFNESHAAPIGRAALMGAFSSGQGDLGRVRVHPCRPGIPEDSGMDVWSSSRAAALVCPLGEDAPGYQIVESVRFGVEPNWGGGNIRIGEIVDRGRKSGNVLTVEQDELVRHSLVVGGTGSGKTNACFLLLEQIWRAGKGTPFLVIESAKTEYRRLLGAPEFPKLGVFTVADERATPLRLNPFEVPEGVSPQTHIDLVNALFASAFVLYPPMPYVLEQAIQEIYLDKGWDLSLGHSRRGRQTSRAFPTLSDLAAKIPVVIERMGYEARITTDVKAGLLARLDQLRTGGGKGRALDTRRSTSAEDLFEQPCIVELQQLVSDAEKAFVMGLLLIRLYEHRLAGGARSGLVHLTLIEEAHRLLKAAPGRSDDAPNTQAQFLDVFANLLSEIRAYGEGIVVAEQTPTKLMADVIKNTNLRIVHRLTSPDDRELMGRTLNLEPDQERRLAMLAVGEAVVMTDRTLKATLIEADLSVFKDLEAPAAIDRIEIDQAPAGRYEACRGCPVEGTGCQGWDPRLDRPSALFAFRRVYNAMRWAPHLASTALQAFGEVTRAEKRPLGDRPLRCRVVDTAEFDLEARGSFAAAPHETVSEAVAAVAALAPVGAGEPILAAPIPDFEATPKLELRPYPGCEACQRPCEYRYDMSSASRAAVQKFQASVKSGPPQMAALARDALDAAGEAVLVADVPSLHGAAYCFAVQGFASEACGMSLDRQRTMARSILSYLHVDARTPT